MPETTVAAIIKYQTGQGLKILLTLRKIEPYRGCWCLPGGHIDRYEPASDAIRREVMEETGLHFEPRFYRYFDEIIPEKSLHAVVLVFVGTASGVLVAQTAEVEDLDWFSLDEAINLDLAFGHKLILKTFAAEPG
jgi:8-oxo-dGTP diphosphatase